MGDIHLKAHFSDEILMIFFEWSLEGLRRKKGSPFPLSDLWRFELATPNDDNETFQFFLSFCPFLLPVVHTPKS